MYVQCSDTHSEEGNQFEQILPFTTSVHEALDSCNSGHSSTLPLPNQPQHRDWPGSFHELFFTLVLCCGL